MTQKSFFIAETFDLGSVAVTYSATLGSAKYTAGVVYYARLDCTKPGLPNGYISALWAKGTGTAASDCFLGLYTATGTAAAGTLYKLGSSADIGGVSNGNIRKTFSNATLEIDGIVVNPNGVLYGALLVGADAGTDHVDVATSTAYAANSDAANQTDPTGGGGWPRAFYGAGTGLTALPASEAMSGVTASGLLPWLAID